ncbi:hypothetical protein V8C40DRAFT_159755 [Trichoderma camerunense]
MTNRNRDKIDQGSDDEFYAVPKMVIDIEDEVEIKSETIIDEIVKSDINFSEPKSTVVERFYNKYKETFKKQEDRKAIPEPGNILHVLASCSSPHDKSSDYWTSEKLTSFLRWILVDHSALLEGKIQDKKEFPLHRALFKRNHSFIQAVVEFDALKNAKTVLAQTRSRRNYIQAAIMAESPMVVSIARRCFELTLPVWNGSGKSGKESETPFHIAVRKVFHLNGLSMDKVLLAEADIGEYSGIKRSYDEWKQQCVIKRRSKDDSAPIQPLMIASQDNGSTTDGSNNNSLAKSERSIHHIPRESVVQLILQLIEENQKLKSISQVDIVKLLIELAQDSLESLSRTDRGPIEVRETPYQERVARLGEAWDELIGILKKDNIHVDNSGLTEEEAMRSVVIGDPVADTIRYHCLRHFDRDKIARCLYQPGDERHIDFDLAGLRNPTISNAFLSRLGKHLRFESILKYVALPKLALEDHSADTDEQNRESSQLSGRQDSNDLRAVFQWLRNNNVKRIIKVSVIDYGSPCHSDAAIEKALEGFNVEIWDWKKVDLCTNVIANSTTESRHISLYSSCNSAVLMGWASSDGLGNRQKFKNLEHVRLFIAKGQEGDRRTSYINEFIKKVQAFDSNAKEKKISVEYHLDDGNVSFAADFKNDEISEQQEVQWISQVKEFSRFMRNIPRKEREGIAPIKIAIIDDGVDASLEFLVGQIAGGKSFCPYASSSDLMNAYYVPSGQHGTMMADLICQICPSCRLYVARLDERPSRSDSTRQITMASAAEAVRWAVACKVDIISMSWTIDGTTADASDIALLDSAINDAKNNNILMFCSTSDHGSTSSDNYYPAKTAECIRIGAATALGDKCTWVPEQYDYLLPGKNLPFQWKRQDGVSSWYESGSSLATALAAGLAGLLLYCDHATNTGSTNSTPEERLHTKKAMSHLFSNLSVTSKDHKFLRADIWFGKKFRRYLQEELRVNIQEDHRQTVVSSRSTKYLTTATSNEQVKLSEIIWSEKCKNALRRLLKEMDNVE